MKPFQFKQFKIHQDKTAMKVGTDGVLLGAWANCDRATHILDIGTGTGLISLMLAQKNKSAQITAIEIDKDAARQAMQNVNESSWQERITVIQTSLQDFDSIEKFDLVISNPPFFNNTFKAETDARNKARQTDSLSFDTLLARTASLLTESGKASFILPFSEKENFIDLAKEQQLFLNKILYVKGNVNTEIKRILVTFSFKETTIEEETISIEISRHNYTQEYIELVQDFYIKM
jgi:tRNA1Val (adenine37-N6)-methyltransferase